MSAEQKGAFVALPNRGLIRIGGNDRVAFLDALISSDMTLLESHGALYACLLNGQGKFLYDFFVIAQGDTLLLDCEGGDRAEGLGQTLRKYRLRSKVEIDVEPDIQIYAGDVDADGWADPRHPMMGRRGLTRPQGVESPFSAWDERRIRLCIPDGSRDMAVEQSTLIESNIDRLNGVAFDKGCYVGQELTARMHLRGLAKRGLVTVQWADQPPQPGTDILIDGTLVGKARSCCGTIGLASLKIDAPRETALYRVISHS